MAPRRSGRRNASLYKKGDYIEYQYKGSTVTGKLYKRSPNGSEANPVWVVIPSDRRRKNEDIPEKALGKIINAEEALTNRGPKLRKSSKGASSPTSGASHSQSDGSLGDDPSGRRGGGGGSPSEERSAAGASSARKRKGGPGGGERAGKNQKTVTFSQKSRSTAIPARKKVIKTTKKAKSASRRIGTRSTRGSGEAVLLPELPARRMNLFKTKKIKKDENVKVVKMLTGTLYLYRGDRPRAEFVRFK